MSNNLDELGDAIAAAVTNEVRTFLENQPEPEPAPSQPSDGLTREEAIDLIESRIGEGGGGGDVSKELIREVVSEELDRLGIPYQAKRLAFPERREGPSEPSGPDHLASRWGIHFEVGTDCFIHSAIVDAGESGSFTAVLAEYDGNDKFDVVEQREIDVDQGTNEIDLNFQVPEAGEYLLTRDGDFPLARDSYAGWDDHAVDNLKMIGGSKPGDFDDNDYWYYFFNLEMTADEEIRFPK